MKKTIEGFNSLTIPEGKNQKGVLDIQGNSYQETRSGKNVFNSKIQEGTYNDAIYTVADDGLITQSASDNSGFAIQQSRAFLLPLGTYTISIFGAKSTTRLQLRNLDTTEDIVYAAISNYTFSLETDTNLGLKTVDYTDNAYPQSFYIQIEKGSEATDYEQYGAMPSLDYPSEIESCGDNVNLLNSKLISSNSLDGVTVTEKDGLITFEGKTKGLLNMATIPVNLDIGTYTFSMTGVHQRPVFTLRTENSTWIQNISEEPIKIEQAGTYLIGLNYGTAEFTYTPEGTAFRIKLEKGTVATPWSKFGEGNINFTISNKNLIKWDYRSMNGITYHDTNKITIKNPTNTPTYLNAYQNLNEIKNFVMGKTLTVTTIVNGTMNTSVMTVTIPTNKNQYRFQVTLNYPDSPFNNRIYKQTIKLQEDEYPNAVNVFTRDPESDLEIIVQMEMGENSTDIITHEEQNISIPVQKPFRAIDNYRDTFVQQNGKWYERHYINRLVVSDTESLSIAYHSDYNRIRIDLKNSILAHGDTDKLKLVKSNCYSYKGLTDDTTPTIHLSSLTTNLYIRDDDSFNSLEGFKTKVKELRDSGNPLYFDYVLAEPELIECTPEQNTILNVLSDIYLYNGINHIISLDNVSPYMIFSYDKTINDFDFYLSENNRLVFPKDDISLL